MDYAIRKCRLDEAEALVELWRRSGATPSATDTPQDVRRALGLGSACVLVAELDGQLVGSIIGTFDGWRGNIYRLAVHLDYRRLGIAGALNREIEKWLVQQGAKRITALVEREHGCATGFWESAGYQIDARMVRYVRTLPSV